MVVRLVGQALLLLLLEEGVIHPMRLGFPGVPLPQRTLVSFLRFPRPTEEWGRLIGAWM